MHQANPLSPFSSVHDIHILVQMMMHLILLSIHLSDQESIVHGQADLSQMCGEPGHI